MRELPVFLFVDGQHKHHATANLETIFDFPKFHLVKKVVERYDLLDLANNIERPFRIRSGTLQGCGSLFI